MMVESLFIIQDDIYQPARRHGITGSRNLKLQRTIALSCLMESDLMYMQSCVYFNWTHAQQVVLLPT